VSTIVCVRPLRERSMLNCVDAVTLCGAPWGRWPQRHAACVTCAQQPHLLLRAVGHFPIVELVCVVGVLILAGCARRGVLKPRRRPQRRGIEMDAAAPLHASEMTIGLGRLTREDARHPQQGQIKLGPQRSGGAAVAECAGTTSALMIRAGLACGPRSTRRSKDRGGQSAAGGRGGRNNSSHTTATNGTQGACSPAA
jgi:hypothetical protein